MKRIELGIHAIEISNQFDLMQIGDTYGYNDPEDGLIRRGSIEEVIVEAIERGHSVTITQIKP